MRSGWLRGTFLSTVAGINFALGVIGFVEGEPWLQNLQRFTIGTLFLLVLDLSERLDRERGKRVNNEESLSTQ